MRIREWSAQFIMALGVCGIISTFNVPQEAGAQSKPLVQAEETQAAVNTAAAEQKEKMFRTELNRAYMNCLLQIDEDLQALARNPKARSSELQAKRDFCENRKKDCLGTRHDDPNCKIFLEDYGDDVE
jgi:hypothetical protein